MILTLKKKKLERNKNVFFKYRKKEKDKKQETLFVLFHGLGQSLDDYESDMWGGMSKEDNKAYKKMRDCLCEMRTGRKYERNNL